MVFVLADEGTHAILAQTSVRVGIVQITDGDPPPPDVPGLSCPASQSCPQVCTLPIGNNNGFYIRGPVDYCANGPTGCTDSSAYNLNGCCAVNASPILINTEDLGFKLTSLNDGVPFKLNAQNPNFYRLSWTVASARDAWLVLDRNGNGLIDDLTELFGNLTPQPEPPVGEQRNGFLALAQYDQSPYGGNGDGVIDSRDLIYNRLLLWQDDNHNGIAERSELHGLSEVGLIAISLEYSKKSVVIRMETSFATGPRLSGKPMQISVGNDGRGTCSYKRKPF